MLMVRLLHSKVSNLNSMGLLVHFCINILDHLEHFQCARRFHFISLFYYLPWLWYLISCFLVFYLKINMGNLYYNVVCCLPWQQVISSLQIFETLYWRAHYAPDSIKQTYFTTTDFEFKSLGYISKVNISSVMHF